VDELGDYSYTAEDLALALRFGWIKKRWRGGYVQTDKGSFHAVEWIRKSDANRALVTPFVDAMDAGQMTADERRESQVTIAIIACRDNERDYHESVANLREMGFDPEEALREIGIDPEP
jgi:hypothetical protein